MYFLSIIVTGYNTVGFIHLRVVDILKLRASVYMNVVRVDGSGWRSRRVAEQSAATVADQHDGDRHVHAGCGDADAHVRRRRHAGRRARQSSVAIELFTHTPHDAFICSLNLI